MTIFDEKAHIEDVFHCVREGCWVNDKVVEGDRLLAVCPEFLLEEFIYVFNMLRNLSILVFFTDVSKLLGLHSLGCCLQLDYQQKALVEQSYCYLPVLCAWVGVAFFP